MTESNELTRKKINCRHGLNERQELEARKLRIKLEEGESTTLELYNSLYKSWFSSNEPSFISFLIEKNMVYYSALKRAIKHKGAINILNKIVCI